MIINENTVAGKWTEIKGEIQKAWGKLTSDDLETTKGDMLAIGGLIQQKYGEAQEVYGNKLNDIFSKVADKKETVLEKIKEEIKKS